mmetsp:Transcript_33263/g.43848  ORF Transcript_33263/g.43848 Transcript_33263/m.43848 type:complete len:383 (-) Transcript_33263:160-1308(-)
MVIRKNGKIIALFLILIFVLFCLFVRIHNGKGLATFLIRFMPHKRQENGLEYNKNIFSFTLEGRNTGGRPGIDIVFLKTPKCGSSTVTQALHRIAWKNNYTIAKKNNLYPINLEKAEKQNLTFDMWVNHCKFTPNLFRLIHQKNHQFVGLVRDPGTRTRSFWTWKSVKQARRQAKKCGCSNWQDCGVLAAKKIKVQECLSEGKNDLDGFKTNFQTYWHIGSCLQHKNFNRCSEELFKDIKNGKHLILIMERMKESLVLLRHAYGLSIDDIVFFPKKVQNLGSGHSNEEERAIKAWQKVHSMDMRLYNIANDTLNRWIEYIGPTQVQRDLHQLKDLTERYFVDCNKHNANPSKNFNENCKCLLLDSEEWEKKFGKRFFNKGNT